MNICCTFPRGVMRSRFLKYVQLQSSHQFTHVWLIANTKTIVCCALQVTRNSTTLPSCRMWSGGPTTKWLWARASCWWHHRTLSWTSLTLWAIKTTSSTLSSSWGTGLGKTTSKTRVLESSKQYGDSALFFFWLIQRVWIMCNFKTQKES